MRPRQTKQTKYFFYFLICVSFSICCFSHQAFAGREQMNVTLNRIRVLLNQVNPLINLAQAEQPRDARIKFQFQTLRQDIAKIQIGIKQAIKPISMEPRRVTPLSGDYLPPAKLNLTEQASFDTGNDDQ